jgi:sigma-B regulation protein RsbU (phosphoserine phosphatase)
VLHAGAHEDIIVSRRGARCERVATLGIWLGVAQDISEQNPVQELVLAPGDLMVLYTDGVIEAMDARRQQMGIDRLTAIVDRERDNPVGEVCDRIVEAAQTWATSRQDDITVVAVRFVPS